MARADWPLRLSKGGLFLACLYPLARWFWLGAHDGLSANPPEFLIRSSGVWALVALWLTLCATPLRRLLGWPGAIRYRRMLGLYAFFYTVLHVLAWGWWDRGGNWAAMWTDVWQRDFILIGTLAVLCLVPLALTSTHGWIRRLGRGWRRLHTLVYPAAVLSVLHFYLMRAGKNDFAEPHVYALILAALLGLRLWWRVRTRPSG
ncbi:protein-methionine-sulfoxide reductase heme-binding subunit MsrQ [Castellaniella sp. GW247-6E4]|uniref:sulfite oxidase heme-binding subunit YedZ n=1 Tax=Castellaniella sp. GW247-6E4 TaxID=3140380 RepID=UPI00331640A0